MRRLLAVVASAAAALWACGDNRSTVLPKDGSPSSSSMIDAASGSADSDASGSGSDTGSNTGSDTGSGSATGSGSGSDTGSGSGSGSDTGSGSGSGSDTGSGSDSTSIDGQIVACYNQGNTSATCTLPTVCCFTNYSSQHEGVCTNPSISSCLWGTIACDGPEDCTNGGHCCSTELFNNDGIAGYDISCHANPCETSVYVEELCHPGGPACANGGTCVSALGHNNDLPRALYICR